MRIHVPPNFPPETLVLFVMSTWHVLVALLISRVGVLRREPTGSLEIGKTDLAVTQDSVEAISC